MDIRVECSQFAPNHGGGGGGGSHGRRDRRDDQDAPADEAAVREAHGLAGDSCLLPENRKSALGLPQLTITTHAAPIDLAGLDDEIHRNLRVMALMMIRLEKGFEARLHAEVGDVLVG